MLAFILQRIGQSAIVMTAVALIAFCIFQFVGDPVQQMIGPDSSSEDVARIRRNLGIDDPVIVQFLRYVGNVVQGNFGV